uniref:Cupin type-1 domain-containing protein n=1 Tax=Populus trichocarpa TaxID=3694 RepID=B9N2L4_POPTR|eukprot:XP_006370929.1 legumin B [Populus trichocarpa]
MSSSTLFSLTLCFLVLFNCCFAQIEQVTSRHDQQQARRRSFQQSECQLQRINALEPARRIKSEAGVTEIWDENDEQFQCAGVAVIRHTIQQRGLLLPAYSNAPKLVYVEQGRGIQGAVFPGCPETFQSSGQVSRDQSQSSEDQHQKVRQVREGDVVALPSGVADWFYNDGDSPLVLVQLLDTSNPANQLDQDFRNFFLAGNPQRELQSQRSSYQRDQFEGQRGRQDEGESRRHQQDRHRNVFGGFDEKILAEAFNIDTRLARSMRNEKDNRGIIVRAEHELQVVSPHQSREEEREIEYRGGRGGGFNGIEETFCTARLKHNINDPERADFFNPRAGRLTTVNSLNLPILRSVQLSVERGVLYPNAMMSPHWNMNAHSIIYITRGNGRIQIVGDNGQTIFDGEVREGQVVTAPQSFAVVKKAGSQGFEWVSFKTNDNAQVSELAGRVSTIRGLPVEVVANSFQISREDARRLKNNREEVSVFSPSQSGRSDEIA